jgi:hypothetical protein
MKKIFFSVFFILFTINANAQFRDGNRLLIDLESQNPTERINALNYVIGVFDMINEVDIVVNKNTKNYMFCQPENMTAGQLSDIVRNHLRTNPGIRHLPAAELIMQTLVATFPCKRQEQPREQRGPDRTS